VVSSDVTRKHLAGVPLLEKADAAAYTPELTRRTYAALLERAGHVLTSGRPVILDATWSEPAARAEARALAARFHAPFRFIELVCDEATVRARLAARSRGPSVSDADLAVLDRLPSYRPADELPDGERVRLDARTPSAALAREAASALRA
jgi:hypothetical protein